APIPAQPGGPAPNGGAGGGEKKKKPLDKPVASVNRPGINRVKPADHFMPKANAISRMPAILRNVHAMEFDPFVDRPTVMAGGVVKKRASAGEATSSTERSLTR